MLRMDFFMDVRKPKHVSNCPLKDVNSKQRLERLHLLINLGALSGCCEKKTTIDCFEQVIAIIMTTPRHANNLPMKKALNATN